MTRFGTIAQFDIRHAVAVIWTVSTIAQFDIRHAIAVVWTVSTICCLRFSRILHAAAPLARADHPSLHQDRGPWMARQHGVVAACSQWHNRRRHLQPSLALVNLKQSTCSWCISYLRGGAVLEIEHWTYLSICYWHIREIKNFVWISWSEEHTS